MKDNGSKKIGLLYILWPSPSKADLIIKKLSEFAFPFNKWKLYALKANVGKEDIEKLRRTTSFEFHRIHLYGSHRNIISRLLYHIFCILAGVKLVKSQGIRIVSQHDGHLEYGLIAYIISRITHRKCLIRVNEDTLIPLIYFLRSSKSIILSTKFSERLFSVFYRKFETFFFKHADWIVTQGPMDYNKIKEITKKITFIPLWVDSQRFRRLEAPAISEFRTELGLAKKTKIFLFVGRLHPEKGIKTLIESLKFIEHQNFILLMIYSFSDYKETYQQLAQNLGVSKKIKFIGYVKNEELPKFYNVADLTILPSIREQWSNTIMESIACETPILATNVGANPYLIKDGQTGYLVPPNDAVSLAKKIQYIIENPDIVKKVTDNSLQEIKKYNKDSISALYNQVINNLV